MACLASLTGDFLLDQQMTAIPRKSIAALLPINADDSVSATPSRSNSISGRARSTRHRLAATNAVKLLILS